MHYSELYRKYRSKSKFLIIGQSVSSSSLHYITFKDMPTHAIHPNQLPSFFVWISHSVVALMNHLRKALTQYKYPKCALDKVEKRFNRPSSEVNDGANNQGTASAQPTTNEVKTKGHIVIPYTQGLCKSIKRSVGGMAYRPTSKGVAPSRTYWSPPRTKTPWSAKVGPFIGSKVVISPVMMNTKGNLQDLWRKIQRAAERSLPYTSS